MRYGCPVCPARFETLPEKKRHVREEHPRKGGDEKGR